MTESRFRLVRRRLGAENQKFEVYFDKIVGPNGQVIDDFLIVRPRILLDAKIGGVVVLPIRDGKVGLMRGYRHQFDQCVWQAPSGFVEPGESAAATARRELEEETALTCDPDDLLDLGTMMPDAGLIESRVALFAARTCRPIPTAAVSEPGAGRLTWHSLDRAEEIAHHDSDIGASTIIAIARFARQARRSG